MKNFVGRLFVGSNAKINVLFVLCLFALVGLGCFGGGRSKDAKPIPAAFLGEWTGQDGAKLNIRNDGTGDYIAGSTEIKGGTAEVDETEKTVSITFFGIGKTLKIDSPPQGNTMKLDGQTFKRAGGAALADTKPSKDDATSDSSNKSGGDDSRSTSTAAKSNAAKYEVPGDEEMQEMTRKALLDFNDAVQAGDFTDFHSKISRMWQRQTSPEKFNEAFSGFIEQKIDISNVDGADAEYSTAPSVQNEGGLKKLIAKGSYDIAPRQVNFTLKWIPEGKEWKLFGIEVELPATYGR
jgi:hypothetical protein